MVWGARIAGIFFLADDLVDTGKMLDRIPGFKKAATGEGVCFQSCCYFGSALTGTSSRLIRPTERKYATT
jgi:hypothetical protein